MRSSCFLHGIGPSAFSPFLRTLPIKAKGGSNQSGRFRCLWHCLSDGWFCMRKNNWKPTFFLGTFQRTALFCSTLCSLPGSKSRCFSYFQPDSHRDASLHRCRRYWRNPQLNLFYRVLSTSPYLNMAVDTFRKNLFFHRTCFPTEHFCSHRT